MMANIQSGALQALHLYKSYIKKKSWTALVMALRLRTRQFRCRANMAKLYKDVL